MEDLLLNALNELKQKLAEKFELSDEQTDKTFGIAITFFNRTNGDMMSCSNIHSTLLARHWVNMENEATMNAFKHFRREVN